MERGTILSLLVLALAVYYMECRVCHMPKIPGNAKYAIKKGKVTKDGSVSTGTELHFSCKKGYIRFGRKKIKCRQNGRWTRNAPVCADAKIRCPNLPYIGNGTQSGNSTKVVSKIYYDCNPGFKMNGTEKMVCLPSGKWSAKIPTCEIKTCRKPFNLDSFKNGNVQIESSNFEYGSTITFFCNDNYYTSRADAMTCNKDGNWEPRFTPKCLRLSCGDPGRPENGGRHGSNFTVGATVSFRCHPGYYVIGSKRRTCQSNLLWSGQQTICSNEDFDCDNPGIPANGRRIGNKFNYGDTVTFECKRGFTLVGSKKRECIRPGNWTGSPVTCDDNNKNIIPSISETANLFHNNVMVKLEAKTCTRDEKGRCVRSRGRSINAANPGGLDLVFLLDASASIKAGKFRMALKFVCRLIDTFGVDYSRGGTRIAAVSFSNDAKIHYNFGDPKVDNSFDACEETRGIPYSNGGTATAIGLQTIIKHVQFRKSTEKAIIMITDGNYNAGGDPRDKAEKLQEKGVKIYTIGIGKNIKSGQLKKIATKKEYVFQLKDYDEFETLTEKLRYEDFGVCGKTAISQQKDNRARVFMGKTANLTEFPWQIALFRVQATDSTFICGGSLIHEKAILTAGHCFGHGGLIVLQPNRYQVIFGEKELRLHDDKARRNFFVKHGKEVKSIFVHPDYNHGKDDINDFRNDIAIIELKNPVTWSKRIRPVCLPTTQDVFKDVNKSQNGYVSGYGLTELNRTSEKLRYAEQYVYSNKTCADRYFDENLMFCAGSRKENGADSCEGDSGGPFSMGFCNNDRSNEKTYKIVGLVSFGKYSQCGKKGNHGYYTRVTHYLDWIKETLQKLN